MIYPTNLQLHTDGHPVLRQVAEPVTEFDGFLNDFVTRMFERMTEWGGVGLAAPQVGVSKRIVVTRYREQHRVWVNPRIGRHAGSGRGEERCLSVPGVSGMVERHIRLTVHYQSMTGDPAKKFFDVKKGDFLGVVMQHEIDHLDGKLFTDTATFVRKALPALPPDPNETAIDRILRQL